MKVEIDQLYMLFYPIISPHKLCDWARIKEYTTSENIMLVHLNISEETFYVLNDALHSLVNFQS